MPRYYGTDATGRRTLIIRRTFRIAVIASLAAMAACISPEPDVNPVIDNAAGAPPIVGSRGKPLSATQSKAVLARLSQESGESDVMQRHLALERAIDGSPLVVGNKTTLLRDGPATFAAMFKTIKAARRYVDLEYFTFEDVESDGKKLGDLLTEKQRAGVQINVIYDAVGSSDTPKELFDRLRQAGVALLEFHPLDPLKAKAGYSVNDRDHRKILVADGTVGIVGGVNLSNVYGSKIFANDRDAPSAIPETWRDTDLVIEGPAVAQLERLFLDTWSQEKGAPLVPKGFFPPLTAKGDEIIHIIGSTPSEIVPQYYATILSAIRNAEKNIWISAAYFVPTHQEQEDLLAAARRGIDVRILVPSKSDSQFALMVGHSRYDELLEAGVKIYELRDKTLHSKTATIDGVWSVIGSSNFDHRSVLFNNEVDAVVLGRATAEQFQAMFEDDFANSDKVDREAWENRPFEQRTREYLARLIEVLL
jgi:cardiolipin synthase